eukprot:5221137-Alexandrium_andersonii.AAC.1
MSASLVGSEMCIRDSARAGGACRGSLGGGSPCWKEYRAVREAPNKTCFCLLYTSDAADDM